MIIDSPDKDIAVFPEIGGRATTWTFRQVFRFCATSILTGALVALPLAIWWPRQTDAEATLKVMRGELTASQVSNLSTVLASDAALGRIAEEFGRRGIDHSPQPVSAAAFILDLLLGRADTAASRAASLRELLAGSVTLVATDGGAGLMIKATAPDADRASDIANGVAAVLVDRENPVFPLGGDPGLTGLEEATRRAEAELRQFEEKMGDDGLAAARRAEAEDQAARQEAAETEARIAELDRKIGEATSLTAAQVLEGRLPDSLEFTALEYHRQRHVEAKLAFDQLSMQLGPRHPRLQNAAGALETARSDLDQELVRLVAELERQKAEATQKLAALRSRNEAASPDIRGLNERLASLEAAAQAARQRYEKAIRAAPAGVSDNGMSLSMEAEAHPERAGVSGWSLVEATGLGGVAGLSLAIALAMGRRSGMGDAEALQPDHRPAGVGAFVTDPPVTEDMRVTILERVPEADVDPPPDDEVPLPQRIRDILYRNAAPAASAKSLPPLVAAVLEGMLSTGSDRSRSHFPDAVNDQDMLDREILELRRQLASLQERAALRSCERR